MAAADALPQRNPAPDPAQEEVARLRALLALAAETIDIAIDGDPREATDLLLELADRLRAELRP